MGAAAITSLSPEITDRSSAGTRRELALRFAPFLAGLVVFLLRAAALAAEPTEWDSALILNGVRHFDVVHSAPHPPGSFLYVQAGRLLAGITPLSAAFSLSLLAAIASGACAGFAWAYGRRLRNDALGAVFAIAITTVPVAAFYGSAIATYSFDYLGCLILLYLGVRVRHEPRMLIWAALVVGVLSGIRPTAVLFALPALMVMAVAARPSRRDLVGSAIALGGSVLLWVIPLALMQEGGLTAWRSASNAMFTSLWNTTSWFGAPSDAARRTTGVALAHVGITTIAYVPAALVAVAGRVRDRIAVTSDEWWLLAIALAVAAPGFAYGALIHWGKSGYLLMFLPGLLAIPFIVAARLPRPWMLAFSCCSVLASLLYAERFFFADGVVPAKMVNRVPVLTSEQYWAPFGDTLPNRRRIEATHRNANRQVASTGAQPGDLIVMVQDNGSSEQANVAYEHPRLRVAMVPNRGPANEFEDGRKRGLPWQPASANTISVAPGGRVFLLSWNAPTSVRPAIGAGEVRPVSASSPFSTWEILGPVRLGDYTIVPG